MLVQQPKYCPSFGHISETSHIERNNIYIRHRPTPASPLRPSQCIRPYIITQLFTNTNTITFSVQNLLADLPSVLDLTLAAQDLFTRLSVVHSNLITVLLHTYVHICSRALYVRYVCDHAFFVP